MNQRAERRVALLRGINVGRATRIAMADLRACTEAAGCREVSTVLATGNVVLTDPRPPAELRSVLEAAFATRFSYNAVVQVLSRAELDSAASSYPFATLDEHHDYLVFADHPEVTERVVEAMAVAIDAEGTEAVAAGPGCVFWRVPRGATLTSAAAAVLDTPDVRQHLTTRNLNTVRRILAVG